MLGGGQERCTEVIGTDWTTPCQGCVLNAQCTTGKERRIRNAVHEALNCALSFEFGIPIGRVAVLADDPPMYKSRAIYLERHGLFSVSCRAAASGSSRRTLSTI
jgi:hypothetical protein